MPLAAALAALRAATAQIQRDGNDSGHAAFASADNLRAFVLTLMRWKWLRMDRAASSQHVAFFASTRLTDEFDATRIIPIVPVSCHRVHAIATTIAEHAAG